MATSMGVSVDANGDLYELFSDGSKKLKEAGYNNRVLGTNWNKTVTPSNVPTNASSVTATPATVTSNLSSSSSVFSQVKTATKDIILFDDGTVPIDLMADLIFEDIGGQELINIARRDTVNGQKVIYQPIKNLSSVEQQYNPNNLISLQSTSDKYFANFSIKLDDKIPQVGGGPGGDYVYIDTLTGNLIVEAVNLEIDEQIEIQVARSGTIYEADFNEGAS